MSITWKNMPQEFTSKDTSINSARLPALFKKIRWEMGTCNADIGGGKYDNATTWLKFNHNVMNIVYDPYNRNQKHNNWALTMIKDGLCDTATVANVLNVIKEPEARHQVILRAHEASREDGEAYFQIYEGDKSGIPKATCKGWQENRKAKTYREEVAWVFRTAECHGNIIIGGKNPRKIETKPTLIGAHAKLRKGGVI